MYYSPILFSKIADLNLTQYHDCEINIEYLNSKDRIIIFSTHSMGYIIRLLPFLNDVRKPFVLITAMEDTQLPLEIDNDFMEKIKTNVYFKHWFSINKTIPDDYLFSSIPYGLNYWTLTTNNHFGEEIQSFDMQNSVLENIIYHSEHFSKRIPKIYANYHLNFTDERHGVWRRKLLDIIPNQIIYYQPHEMPRSTYYTNMTEYMFVVSPFGHGFDCIRTFEALSLGCIVIMQKCVLDIVYEDLPVYFVNNWEDINENLLITILNEFSNKTFNYSKLKMKYYIDLVNNVFEREENSL